MYTSQADRVLLGRGKVYFDRFNTAGAALGLRYLGTVSKLELSISDEKAKIYDYAKPTAPLLNEVVTRREVSVAMTLHEYTKENLALALMGEESNYQQLTGSVVDESLSASILKGRVYQLANRNVNAVVVKRGAATLVLGTDYDIVDAYLGLIHIREGSVTVIDGDANITASYTKGTIASPGLERVLGAKSSQIIGKLVFVGDPGAGPALDAEIWRLSISSEGVLGFITGDDFAAIELKGEVLSDETNHATEPYFRVTKRV